MNIDKLASMVEELQWRQVPALAVAMAKQASEGKGTLLSELLLQTKSTRPGLNQLQPSPLASMLAGGIIGGGLGYGAASLAGSIMPNSWDKKKFKRNAMLLGALSGTLPGVEWGALNRFDGQPFNSTHFLKDSSVSSGLFPAFSPAQFNHVVWNDPRVANQMTPPERAAITGFVTGAANSPAKSTTSALVTPMDMGRMAIGMGSGYASGAIVGKALGALMGMPEPAQERLKTIGLWGGIAKSLVPVLF